MKSLVRSLLVVTLLASPLFAQHLKVLHAFSGSQSDGINPYGGLVRDSHGNLYGTTFQSGIFSEGTVYKVTPSGQESVLYSFAASAGGGSFAGLVRDSSGNLYGTSSQGGASTWGNVFKLDSAGNESSLYGFRGLTQSDGSSPQYGRLVRDAAGNLYGTTPWGGVTCTASNFGCGTVFKIDSAGNETILHTFTGGADGGLPWGGLLLLGGDLYGAAETGGSGQCSATTGCGVIYKLDMSGNQTILHNFSSNGSDGYFPAAALIADAAGNLYGTTDSGGTFGTCGTVFKLDSAGNETVLHSFNCTDGRSVWEPLVMDAAGNLYGTTPRGGKFDSGVVYKVDSAGNFSLLHTFTGGLDGGMPYSDLILDKSGNLYGTTSQGGGLGCVRVGCGVVFKLMP